jgi:hypothetical protein
MNQPVYIFYKSHTYRDCMSRCKLVVVNIVYFGIHNLKSTFKCYEITYLHILNMYLYFNTYYVHTIIKLMDVE